MAAIKLRSKIGATIKMLMRQGDESIQTNARIRAAAEALSKSIKPCPSCHPENDCYVFSMRAWAEFQEALKSIRH